MFNKGYNWQMLYLVPGFVFVVNSCNSGSKDTVPAENQNSDTITSSMNSNKDSSPDTVKENAPNTVTSPANGPADKKAAINIVTIENMKFNPATVTIKKGDKVTFINNDIVAHNATEKNKVWASPLLANGKSWTFAPEKTSDYYCTVHVVMTGKIIVE